jgi:hypothetical protein
MHLLMGGAQRISIDVAIIRDGRSLSLKLNPKVFLEVSATFLEALQQLNGNHTRAVSVSPRPTRSCSV